ncbi:ParB/RepB/Spo0J family partition protein [Eubacteriales bacterium OttesenSCG-928-M02]|nr:ParB/RepB/Spo0J family partition protein [Eubacteriales bacterium OttesenSCG-928-M02]
MSGKTRDLGLTAYDDLFSDDNTRAEAKLAKIHDIPLADIDDFPDHPYQVRLDEDMDQLVQSVKERGIITPVTLRPKEDGRYELVSGHRRKKACELAGLSTIKAEIKELSRDEAIILMVESNLQRSTILPSEKAFSYKMRLEAMNRQGQRSDLTSSPMATKLPAGRADEELAQIVGEGKDNIRRYIRLTNLIPPILDMVDESKIAFRPAVEISYLPIEQQVALYNTMECEDCTPSLAQAIKMKQFSQEGRLNEDVIFSILREEKPNQKEKISFQVERLRQFIPKSVPLGQTEDYVLKALEHYNRFRERRRDKER